MGITNNFKIIGAASATNAPTSSINTETVSGNKHANFIASTENNYTYLYTNDLNYLMQGPSLITYSLIEYLKAKYTAGNYTLEPKTSTTDANTVVSNIVSILENVVATNADLDAEEATRTAQVSALQSRATTLEGYFTNGVANTAIDLSGVPSLSASTDNTKIKVTVGNKTSAEFTVPYATNAGNATGATSLVDSGGTALHKYQHNITMKVLSGKGVFSFSIINSQATAYTSDTILPNTNTTKYFDSIASGRVYINSEFKDVVKFESIYHYQEEVLSEWVDRYTFRYRYIQNGSSTVDLSSGSLDQASDDPIDSITDNVVQIY